MDRKHLHSTDLGRTKGEYSFKTLAPALRGQFRFTRRRLERGVSRVDPRPFSTMEACFDINLLEVCQSDSKPTMIVDLDVNERNGVHTVFSNSALAKSPTRLLDTLKKDEPLDTECSRFVEWAKSPFADTSTHSFEGLLWISNTLRGRWRIISGVAPPAVNVLEQKLEASQKPTHNRMSSGLSLNARLPAQTDVGLDWTLDPPLPNLSGHAEFIRSIDWASTAIGPMDSWCPLLRSLCNLIVADPDPAAIFWGEASSMIYNEAFITIAGQKHPKLMGQHPAGPFAEIWDYFEGIIGTCGATGKSRKEDNVCLALQRHGFTEETYVSFTFTPILGANGVAVGNYHTVREHTRSIITERRMTMLVRLGQSIATAQRLEEYWRQVLLALETNENDVPYAILYSVRGAGDTDASSSTTSEKSCTSRTCSFEGSIGIPNGHACVPLLLDLDHATDGFAPNFRQATKQLGGMLVETVEYDFSKELATMNGTHTPPNPRGFGDVCKRAIICPLRPTNDDNVIGFLVMGVNPRRPYDADYKIFIELMTRQLATSLASIVLYEEETRRGRSAAAQAELEQAQLSEELQLRTQEIKATEHRFTRLTQLAPVGIFIRDASGNVVYCNDKWYEMTGHTKSLDGKMSWKTTLDEANKHVSSKEWETLLRDKIPVTYETKLKIPWKPPIQINEIDDDKEPTWILTSAYPELDSEGRVTSIVGFVTAISQQKWAEKVQQRKVDSVLEAKRQQENFIDMTSHEIRNPLSAIMQCADGIISWLGEIEAKKIFTLEQLVDSSVDAAQTILYCAQHQKNIVDDILTLSKMDANLLSITPVPADPYEIVQNALKMFEVQLTSSHIKAEVHAHPSIKSLAATQLNLDPSRLMQVLVNLITNAIKFTKSEPKREIKVTIAASLERPLFAMQNQHIVYFPRKNSIIAPPQEIEEEQDQDPDVDGTIFLHIAVKDTGCGLSNEEKKKLFLRFSQASPRTHVQYGGSGLGLFICRELVDLQGGQIGVESAPGVGTTFAFYIQVRRLMVGNMSLDTGAIKLDKFLLKQTTINSKSTSRRNSEIIKTAHARAHAENLNILIVEDNIVNQRVLAKQLLGQGCRVSVANHGQEALTYIRGTRLWASGGTEEKKQQLDMVLMDVEMPVMDGLTCTREIRRLQYVGDITEHVPIIAVSANARKEQVDMAIKAGVDRVIAKPFRIKDLMVLMEKTMNEMQEEKMMSDLELCSAGAGTNPQTS